MAKAARANVLQVEVEELRRDLSTATAVSQVAGMDAADTAVAPSGILLQLDDEEAAEAQAAEEEEAHAQSWSVRMEAKVGEQALAKDAIAIRFIVKIQARIRGRQARRRAAEKRLAALREQEAADPPSGGGSRLEMDVAEWLGAQGESRLAAVVKFDFGAETLCDLIAVVQDREDWEIFVPGDPGRCDALWDALCREVAAAGRRR